MHVCLLLALAAGVVGYDLGASSLHNGDEAKHALVAGEILSSGDWIHLTYQGRPYLWKAPLKFWMTAATFALLGVSEFTVRLWSAVFAVATVLLLYRLSSLLFDRLTGLLASGILLTCHQYVYNHGARTGELDTGLVFFWTGALFFFVLAFERRSPGAFYWACVWVGMCGMVKHLALIPPLLVLALPAAWLVRPGTRLPARTWWLGLGLVLTICLPWHLVQMGAQGTLFWDEYVGEQVSHRVGWAGVVSGARGLLYYASVLKDGAFPWSLLLPFALLSPLWTENRPEGRRVLLVAVWLGGALLMASLTWNRLYWYLLPAYPPLAMLVGNTIRAALRKGAHGRETVFLLMACWVALASLTTAGWHNPFAGMAVSGMVRVQLLGRLEGWLWIPALALAGLVVVRLRAGKGVAAGWVPLRTGALLILWLLGAYQVLAPLRFSRTRVPIHDLVLTANRELGEEERVLAVLGGTPIQLYYLAQLQSPLRSVGPARAWEEIAGGRAEALIVAEELFLLPDASGGQERHDLSTIARAGGISLLRIRAQAGGD